MNNISMTVNADELILLALKEDITSEDITTASVMPEYKLGEVSLICKQDGIICGLPAFSRVYCRKAMWQGVSMPFPRLKS